MKWDWQHVTLVAVMAAFILALVFFALKNTGLMPVATLGAGAFVTFMLGLFKQSEPAALPPPKDAP